MIISASRRTDIAAFYAEWLINRVKAGHCTVPNPFNRKQISRISLQPADIDAIVFWTRNPAPLMRYLFELDDRQIGYYFQYTILGYPSELDPKSPPLNQAITTFRKLADRVGPERVIWRYDPIVFSDLTSTEYHREQYSRIAEALAGYTRRSVISIVDRYRKAAGRIKALVDTPIEFHESLPDDFPELMRRIVDVAQSCQFQIFSCAEELDLGQYGISAGKCIDDELINDALGRPVKFRKDKTQRDACGCVESRDIGMYDTCVYGCPYCYATQSFNRAADNLRQHDPNSPSLVGWYEREVDQPLFNELDDE